MSGRSAVDIYCYTNYVISVDIEGCPRGLLCNEPPNFTTETQPTVKTAMLCNAGWLHSFIGTIYLRIYCIGGERRQTCRIRQLNRTDGDNTNFVTLHKQVMTVNL